MQKLLLRKPVRFWLTGKKNKDRWIGVCYLRENDIGALAVVAGQARDCPAIQVGDTPNLEQCKVAHCLDTATANEIHVPR